MLLIDDPKVCDVRIGSERQTLDGGTNFGSKSSLSVKSDQEAGRASEWWQGKAGRRAEEKGKEARQGREGPRGERGEAITRKLISLFLSS